MKPLGLAVGVLLIAGLCACGGGDTGDSASAGGEATGDSASADGSDEPTGDCVKLTPSSLDSIDDGLTIKGTKVTEGQAVELADDQKDLGVEYVAAVNVNDPQNGDQVVLLGIGSPTDGPIMVGDELARVYFTWGTAATEGSPAKEFQDTLALTPAADKAKGCIG